MFKNMAKPNETIIEHTTYCYNIAKKLVPIFKNELTVLDSKNLNGEEIFLLSVLLHDTGKYAQPFQNKTLNEDYKGVWRYRHEIFSAEFVNIFTNLNNDEKRLIKLAILSHHNKTINQLEKATFEKKATATLPGLNLQSMFDNREKAYKEGKNSILKYNKEIFSEIKLILKNLNKELRIQPDKLENNFDLILDYYQSILNHENKFDFKKLTFLKGLLVTADHLGSGHLNIVKIDKDVKEYYKNKFRIPQKGTFRSIQKYCIQSKGVSAILKAPTGAGKTEAAFLWANENLRFKPASRIFYILPYTASINAMFSRLSKCDFSKDKIDVLHGKNTTYFFDLITKKKAVDYIEENIDEINKEIKMRKFTSKSFASPIKIITPHQIIKNFYGLKHFEESFIQYYNGLFVFDEIHCYNKVFLAELLGTMKFIKENMKGKFLFMSATFPKIVEELIREILNIETETIQFNQNELNSYTRTKLNMLNGNIEDGYNLSLIQNDITNNKKRVLIVCNTIKKAQEIFSKINCNDKILLHSAFNNKDRKIIENKVIDGEKSAKQLQVLVGTQAIEVSLDLDYDCCYSEIASIDALIQRFGRVYRNRKKEKNDCGIVNVFAEPDKATLLIYNENIYNECYDIIGKTREKLYELDGRLLSYNLLCKAVDFVYNQDYKKSVANIVYDKIKQFENKKLIPMKDYSDEAKIYFEQFDGIKVLPSSLFNEYEDLVAKKRYVDADNLLVNLSERKLYNYYRKKIINKMEVVGRRIFVAEDDYIGYDSKVGLYLKDSYKSVII